MMQQTDGAWRKIGSKQLMQQSRRSLLIQLSVTMCNMLREADLIQGVMSGSGFVLHPICRLLLLSPGVSPDISCPNSQWQYESYCMFLYVRLFVTSADSVIYEGCWMTSRVTFNPNSRESWVLIRLMACLPLPVCLCIAVRFFTGDVFLSFKVEDSWGIAKFCIRVETHTRSCLSRNWLLFSRKKRPLQRSLKLLKVLTNPYEHQMKRIFEVEMWCMNYIILTTKGTFH